MIILVNTENLNYRLVAEYLKQKPLVLSTIINICILAFFFLFVTPQFESNDDPAMMAIASGTRLGEPSEFIIFINVFLGLGLKTLYSLVPELNWYVIMLYSFQLLAMIVLLYSLLKYNKVINSVVCYILFVLFFQVYFMNNLQFTSTAFLLGISGILLLLQFDEQDNRHHCWYTVIAGITLLVLAGLVRS